MPFINGFSGFAGLFRYIINFALTVIGGLFLYIVLSILTAIALYFIKKNDLKEFVPQYDSSNLIFLNSASIVWHKTQRRR